MSYQHTVAFTIQTPAGPVSQAPVTYTDTLHAGVAPTTLPAGATTTYPNVGIDVSQMTSLVMYCSRDCTVVFTGTPTTVDLIGGVPLIWNSDSPFSNPVGAVDVTQIAATLASGDDATFLVDVLYH